MSNQNALLTFQEMLSNLRARSDWQSLPDIRLAMWPGQVSFSDDLSDPRMFNERYVESRVFAGKMAFVLYLLCGAFLTSSAFILYFVWWTLDEGGTAYEALADSWVIVLLSALTGWLAGVLLKLEPACVRFNRQAQVVHIYDGPSKATTVAWRDVHPFTEFSTSADGKFAIRLVFQTGPADLAMASGAFDIGDESAMIDNLTRLEFLRRYMAEGLTAVQPDPQRIPCKPSGFTKSVTLKEDGVLSFLLAKFFVFPAYCLAGGPFIDRYLLRRASLLQWPAEVERLCAPDADLSGYDTTPVRPHKHHFYRFDGRGIEIVGNDGNAIG
ncbi:hypothetical protein LMG26686_01901 [Achromobacter mucicolens]|uniref:hypothetical protein n=1 Tax=Achromobacter mucicolens TaxID=1389922 RepID=UPI001465321A|nr:hypothetical protein [Achromobacter mucicolens]CAB3849845.1 hypothetical protein LMG26686_01901 [Achromobacter mucicolens]